MWSTSLLGKKKPVSLSSTEGLPTTVYFRQTIRSQGNGLFTLPDSNSNSYSDSDSKPDGYIVLCRSFHIGSDPDPDPCTDRFPNRYCTHFRDRYLSQFHTFQSGDQSPDLNQCEISA